jgi:predicted ATP-grasp superfamily ATP-dependent carboligase
VSAAAARAEPPTIVLGSGISALGVLRIIGRDRLQPLVAEVNDPLLRRSRWFRPAPNLPPAFNDDVFRDWLETLPGDRYVLMPCSDHWVRRVAEVAPELRRRFPASVPARASLHRLLDKGAFAELLHETGTPHPRSYAADEESDLEAVPDAVFSSAILKPRDSQPFIAHFGVKAVHVSSRDDARRQLRELHAGGFSVILQEYIPGPPGNHYFVDGFVDRFGAVQAIFVRRRLRMYPLDFGNSTAMVSVEPAEASDAVAAITRLLAHLEYRGMFSAEFKRDPRDGVFKIVEVNARAWWYVEYAARCGVDVCRMAYDDALDRPVARLAAYSVGRRLVFPYYDYPACVAESRRSGLTRAAAVRSWMGAMQPVFQLHDPKPGLHSFFNVLKSFVANRVRKLVRA